LDYRKNELIRVNGRVNEEVNEEWTCDRGKFGHDVYSGANRLASCLVRDGNELVPAPWNTAAMQALDAYRTAGVSAGVLAGPTLSNEDYASLVWLFKDQLGIPNVDHRFEKMLPRPSESVEAVTGVSQVQNRISDFETLSKVLVFGTSLADEEPILYLRLRKGAIINGVSVAVVAGKETEVHQFAKVAVQSDNCPNIARALDSGQNSIDTGLSDDEFARLMEIASGAAIITTRGIYDEPFGQDAAIALANLARRTGGTFNCYARSANEEGAMLAGVLPSADGWNTHQMLQGAIEGTIKSLWLVGVDPFNVGLDEDTVRRALESVEFLVVQHWTQNDATPYASVVLPMTTPIEAAGSYTNLERRVQWMGTVLPAPGDAKPAWRTFSDLSMRVQPRTPFFNAGEVLGRLAQQVPAFQGVSEAAASGEGYALTLS
jgi:predicted molibdopterin-dependent oxidoreductase YjgC